MLLIIVFIMLLFLRFYYVVYFCNVYYVYFCKFFYYVVYFCNICRGIINASMHMNGFTRPFINNFVSYMRKLFEEKMQGYLHMFLI